MPWKVDLREHENGRLSERLQTADMREAEAWFRKLLAREDLIGWLGAARVVSPITGRAIYFSRFDDERRRIHPEAPLDLFRTDDGTAEATKWRPGGAPDPKVALLKDLAAIPDHNGFVETALLLNEFEALKQRARALLGWN